MMRLKANKKAEDLTFIKIAMALAIVLIVMWIMLPLISKIVDSSKETVSKGICGGMLAVRSKMTAFIVGDIMKSSTLFSLSPSCGNAYTEPCKQSADCLTKIRRQIDYCWKMTRNDPSTEMTCLYNLDIDMSDTPSAKLCESQICPGNPCKAGEADVKKEDIEFIDAFCAKDKDSISMTYNGKKVVVTCQGQCK